MGSTSIMDHSKYASRNVTHRAGIQFTKSLEQVSAASSHSRRVRGDSYSGIDGIAIQDGSLQESMGPIIDRTKENLVSTDNGIIMARHRLMRAAKDLLEKGTVPPGVDVNHQRVRSAAVVLPADRPFKDAAKEQLRVRDGVAPASV